MSLDRPVSSLQKRPPAAIAAFDQPVVLQQPSIWSHVILWSLIVSATGAVTWAAVAPIEQAVQAQGKLEPSGKVQEVRAPVNGVVRAVLVREGK
ncbi:MAG: hypothetical protein NZ821_08700, partial [Gloeomargarita sp. SKYB31]|nr:hypothetical protein [Gloeomargarita sp. SKYB31]